MHWSVDETRYDTNSCDVRSIKSAEEQERPLVLVETVSILSGKLGGRVYGPNLEDGDYHQKSVRVLRLWFSLIT